MDMFMDKLAQKLTAQEMIKANTAADTEELNRLKSRVAAYNECLEKLQKLIDEGLQFFQIGQNPFLRLPGIRHRFHHGLQFCRYRVPHL